jgi:hypothetical protein
MLPLLTHLFSHWSIPLILLYSGVLWKTEEQYFLLYVAYIAVGHSEYRFNRSLGNVRGPFPFLHPWCHDRCLIIISSICR